MGSTIGFADLSPTGACTITGLLAGFDGQLVTITNLTANALTLTALDSNSTSANQFRLVGSFTLGQNNGITFRYSTTIGHWVAL
jgi:hypothetical protein